MSLYEVLKASKLGGGAPDYWTELFARRVAGGWTVSTITGTLPITFRSNGTALIDYRIFGTAEGAGVQTENLADVSKSGMIQITVEGAMRYGLSLGKLEAGDYTVVYTSKNTMYITRRFSNNTYSSGPVSSGTVITITSNTNELIFRTTSATETTWEAAGVSDIMIVKGSTAPTSHIPYGYKIPLTVTSSAELISSDIYIGNTKLLSTDYIDYESGKIVRNGTPQDPPLPLPELETFKGTNTLDSTETLGEVTIKGQIKPQS